MTVNAALFYLIATFTLGSALGVAVSMSIVRTATFLLLTLVGVAGVYLMLGAEFLAAVQLVVFAGGTLVLIVFGVMLTSRSPFVRYNAKPIEIALAVVIGATMLSALAVAIIATKFHAQPLPDSDYAVSRLGQALLGDFLIPFEILSVVLLVAMIGAAYLAKARSALDDGTRPSSSAGEEQSKS